MMKKVFVSLCAMCAVFAFTSCRSAKEVVTLDALNGEWNIIEINGSTVVPTTDKSSPYIGFDTSSGKVFGNSGCNRMMGAFNKNTKPGELYLSDIAGTRMMCPDMTIEQNVLNTLKNVKGYKKTGTNKIALTNARKRPVIVLAPRESEALIASLNGEWEIVQAKGKEIPSDVEKIPFINFNISTKRIHGNASCNVFNGSIVTDESNPYALVFPLTGVTMMACPDMDVERDILDALNSAKSFDVFANKNVGLYDEDGTLLLLLKRK